MTAYAYKEIPITQRDDILIAKLLRLWKASVRATHHFLINDAIAALEPYVVEGLKVMPIIFIALSEDEPIAFMGIADKKIEMLFVAPEHFGRGIGKHLVSLAIKGHQVEFVDANEQNPQAVGFYRHLGFVVYERTETDDQGNHYPILRMRMKP